MDKYTIIRLKLDGKSNRNVAQILGIDRKTVAGYWNDYKNAMEKLGDDFNSPEDIRMLQSRMLDAPKYDSSNRRPIKYTDEIDAYLDEILSSEAEKNRILGNHKQQLSGVQIYEMIKSKGFDIGQTVIYDHIKEKREKQKEAYIRQEYDFGDRLEYDFGEVELVIGSVFQGMKKAM